MVNYKHLHYFWAVAREGGIAWAGERLHLTPQTISGQLPCQKNIWGRIDELKERFYAISIIYVLLPGHTDPTKVTKYTKDCRHDK